MKKNSNKIRRFLYAIIVIFTFTLVAPIGQVVSAEEGSSSKVEKELISIMNEYKNQNVQVKDGLFMEVGEIIPYDKLTMEEETSIPFTPATRNESVVAINENGEFVAVGEGETFIVLKGDLVTYIYEVAVKSQPLKTMSLTNSNSLQYNLTAKNASYRVFIDAGHGGGDPGACANGLREKDLNLAIALKVQRNLEAMGVDVVMRRTTDVFNELSEISSMANNSGADAFASIHIDSFGTSAYGISTYYYPGRTISNPLANSTQTQLINSTGAYDRGVRTADYHVVRETTMPSILIENGFISNAAEAAKLATDAYQEKLARGISNGMYNYLKANISLDSIPGERICGVSRYETSYSVAKKGWSSADTVVIAAGSDYPDALCAAPLAAKYNAPILLATNTSLSTQNDLKNLISSLGVKKVFIVGGTGVLSATFENDIKDLSISTERLGGLDRYETSIKIAEVVGGKGEFAVATGYGFADSLSISAVAAEKGMPILLTKINELPSNVRNYLNGRSVTRTYVIGGVGVVSDGVANTLPNVVRLGGNDRYDTNEKIFNEFKSNISTSTMYMALGTNFPDALSASAVASKNGSFVLLSNQGTIMEPVRNIIEQNRSTLQRMYILGGPSLISDSMLNYLNISF